MNLAIEIAALIVAFLAVLIAMRTAALAAALEARIEHGLNRDDLDKLHERINSISEKLGGLTASVQQQGSQITRMDSYLRHEK